MSKTVMVDDVMMGSNESIEVERPSVQPWSEHGRSLGGSHHEMRKHFGMKDKGEGAIH